MDPIEQVEDGAEDKPDNPAHVCNPAQAADEVEADEYSHRWEVGGPRSPEALWNVLDGQHQEGRGDGQPQD